MHVVSIVLPGNDVTSGTASVFWISDAGCGGFIEFATPISMELLQECNFVGPCAPLIRWVAQNVSHELH